MNALQTRAKMEQIAAMNSMTTDATVFLDMRERSVPQVSY